MKSLRFVRRLGKRGTFILPKEIREELNITPEDEFEVFIDDDQLILSKKSESMLKKIEQDLSREDFKKGLEPIINTLIELLVFEDEYMKNHIIKVRKSTEKLANLLSKKEKFQDYIDQSYIKLLKKAVFFYNIGIISFPLSIIQNDERLNQVEINYLKEHTNRGSEILNKLMRMYPEHEFLELANSLAKCHHEKWDGTGYPDSLKGEEIPLSSRIVAVVEVFHALISEKNYRKAYSKEEALKFIEEESGKHFDPDIAEVFLSNKSFFMDI